MKKINVKNTYKLKIAGSPEEKIVDITQSKEYGVAPSRVKYIKPKVVVKIGDAVKIGSCLFFDKKNEVNEFLSPVSGTIKEIIYGDKRIIKAIIITSDNKDEKEVYKMYDDALAEEKRWATHLFSKGSMIGLSEKLLHQYVEYIANRRMRAIGLEPKYEQSINTNPLPWTEHWLNSRSLQNAPQETEIESYVIGGIKQDVKKDQFKKFKL